MGVNVRNYIIEGIRLSALPKHLTEKPHDDFYDQVYSAVEGEVAIIDTDDDYFVGKIIYKSLDGRMDDLDFRQTRVLEPSDREKIRDQIFDKFNITCDSCQITMWMFTRYS